MTRTPLPNRRPALTRKLTVTLDGGREVHILVTIGFEVNEAGTPTVPREVFCADFKAGTALHGIVVDACILMSQMLQRGTAPRDLLASMGTPLSLVGQIAQAVAEHEQLPGDAWFRS